MRSLIALLAALAALAIAPAAQAATFTVVAFGDAPGAGCSGTDCQSLRAAVAAAKLSPLADTIVIPGGDFQLTEGQILLDSDITIVGGGARNTTIRGNPAAFRVFEVPASVTASISGVSLVGGRANPQVDNSAFFAGGLIRNSGSLTLSRVRVTGGIASSGGGVANTGGTMTINRSLIDTNNASIGGSDAGGLLNFGGGNLVVRNTTIAFNQAGSVGGYNSWGGNPAQPNTALFEFVTIARNGSAGVSRDVGNGDTLRARGSIITGNMGGNCAQTPENLGGNIEAFSDCGFGTSGSPLVSDELTNQGGQTNVVNLTSGSAAQDLVPAGQCLPTDQRGATRPIGTACDAGALEAGPMTTGIETPVQDAVTIADSLEIRGVAPANVAVTVFRAGAVVGDTSTDSGGDFAVTVPLVLGTQTFEVEAGTNARVAFNVTRELPAQPTPTPTPPPAPTVTPTPIATPTPTPVANRSVVVEEVKGTVKVRPPGSKTFVDIDEAEGIRTGSVVDTRKGTVELTSVPKAGAPAETAKFYDGLFKVTQSKGVTVLTLVEELDCPKRGKAAAAAKKAKKRKLWGDGKGAFRTSGRYSAATVRGTKWSIEDTCTSTTVTVRQGSVSVRDTVLNKTIIRRAGQKYVARPRR